MREQITRLRVEEHPESKNQSVCSQESLRTEMMKNKPREQCTSLRVTMVSFYRECGKLLLEWTRNLAKNTSKGNP